MKKIFLGIILLLVLGLIIFFSPIFKVKHQSFNQSNTPCLNLKGVSLIGQNIFVLNQTDLFNKLSNQFLCVFDVKIDKKLPDSVVVNIKGRTPAVKINLVSSESEASPSSESAFEVVAQSVNQASISASYLVDQSGLIFSRAASNVPELNYLGADLHLGDRLPNGLISNYLMVLANLRDLSIPVLKTPIVRANYLLIDSSLPNSLLFSLDDNLARELASLQLILRASKINPDPKRMIETIDLRFNKPIITYTHG